jgi:hypothetical protein
MGTEFFEGSTLQDLGGVCQSVSHDFERQEEVQEGMGYK